MCIICPKIFAKLEFFATMSRMAFSQLSLAYPVLKILEDSKNKHNFFRVKDNLAALP